MRNLPQNVLDNYRKKGVKWRRFVELPDLGIRLATAKNTVDGEAYANRLDKDNRNVITWDSPYFGGVGSISNTTVSSLELGRDVPFCSEASLSSFAESGIGGCGRVVGTDYGAYLNARNAETGSVDTVSMIVGRRRTGGAPAFEYNVYRPFMQFDVPTTLTKCEDAAITADGIGHYTGVSFGLLMFLGEWPLFGSDGMFNDFEGWATGSEQYGGTILNEAFTSDVFDLTAGNAIRFNAHGRRAIENASIANGGSGRLKLMLLSSLDYQGNTAADPTANEFITFDAATVKLKLRYNTKNLLNSTARLFLGCDPVPESTDDMLRIWSGIVEDWSLPENTLDLKLRQNNFKQDVKLPTTVLSKENQPLIHDSYVGKPVPDIYGDFTSAELLHKGPISYVQSEAISSNYYGLGDYALGYVHNSNTTDTRRINAILAGHKLKSIHHTAVLYEDSLKNFAILGGVITDISDTEGAKIQITEGDSTKWPYKNLRTSNVDTVIQPIVCLTPTVIDHFAFDPGGSGNTILNLMHEEIDSELIIGGDGQKDIAMVSFQNGYGVSNLMPQRYVCFKVRFLEPYYSNPCKMIVQHYFSGLPQESKIAKVVFLNHEGWYWVMLESSDLPQDPSIASDISVAFDTNALSDRTQTAISNVSLCSGFVKPVNDKIFMQVQGRYAEDSTIAPVNTLFEKPAHIVEAIARYDMKLGDEDIVAEAFDTSAAATPDLKFAFQLIERTSSMKLFDELGKQSKSTISFDDYGRLTMRTFDRDQGFPCADPATPWIPNELDIFDQKLVLENDQFKRHHIIPRTFDVKPMSIREVKNSFQLHYKYNYASGQYEGFLQIDHGDGNPDAVETNIDETFLENGMTLDGPGGLKELTSSCYTRIQSTNTMVIRCPAVRDPLTATRLLQHQIERRTRDAHLAKFWTWMSAIAHEEGDWINIHHKRLTDGNLLGYERMLVQPWEIMHMKFDQDNYKIYIEALQI